MEDHELEPVKPAIEIEEHIEAQKTGFKIQKAGLIILITFVVLAAAGLFGDGLLSKQTVTGNGASIRFDRYIRFESRTEVKVNAAADGAGTTMSFPASYLEMFRVEGITPEPGETQLADGHFEYIFNGSGAHTITFYLVPQQAGSIEGELIVNGESLRIHHFIYP